MSEWEWVMRAPQATDAEVAALRAELQTARERIAALKADELFWYESYRRERNRVVARAEELWTAREQIIVLRSALAAVEWVTSDAGLQCPWCELTVESDGGHAADCQRQVALAGKEKQ